MKTNSILDSAIAAVSFAVLLLACGEWAGRNAAQEPTTCSTDSECGRLGQYVEWHRSGMVRPE